MLRPNQEEMISLECGSTIFFLSFLGFVITTAGQCLRTCSTGTWQRLMFSHYSSQIPINNWWRGEEGPARSRFDIIMASFARFVTSSDTHNNLPKLLKFHPSSSVCFCSVVLGTPSDKSAFREPLSIKRLRDNDPCKRA